jgi:FKBP-type peptidyl-prolyl cis-trans isomerase (trigger factor)
LRNKYTTIETAEADKSLQWGEIAKFSFKGYSEASETPDEDLCGTDNVIMVGNHSIVIPEIEEALVEMKANDTKTITCKLPDDLAEKLPKNPRAKLVAGKTVRFEITLHEVQVKKIPSDEEIATKEGKESFKDLYLAYVNEEVVEAEKHPKESMETLLKQIITDNETVLSAAVTPVILDHRLNTFLNRYQNQLVNMEETARQKVVQDSVERLTKSVYQDITINSLAHQFAEQIGDATDEEVKAYLETNKSQGFSYWQAYQQVQHEKLMNMMAERCQPKFDAENESFKAVVDAIPATTKPIDEIVTEVAEAASTKDNA